MWYSQNAKKYLISFYFKENELSLADNNSKFAEGAMFEYEMKNIDNFYRVCMYMVLCFVLFLFLFLFFF